MKIKNKLLRKIFYKEKMGDKEYVWDFGVCD